MRATVATVTYFSDRDGSEMVEINDHKIQFGGMEGDGYCYGHQSFDCIGNLTLEEQVAVINREYLPEFPETFVKMGQLKGE